MPVQTGEPIPRASEWYAKEPFDPSVIAYRDDAGVAHYFMRSPLDETYETDLDDSYSPGAIPPEEREVRDTLLVSIIFRRKVSKIDFLWSQIFKPTKSYLAARDCFQKLNALCERSREHRAAFCRLSNSMNVPDGLRVELRRIVEMCDKQSR